MLAYLANKKATISTATSAMRIEAWKDLYGSRALDPAHPLVKVKASDWQRCLDACRYPLTEHLFAPGSGPITAQALDSKLCDAIRTAYPSPPGA